MKPINVTCTALYRPETVTYDIIVDWTIDVLAAAAVLKYELLLFIAGTFFHRNLTTVEVRVRSCSY